MARNIAIKAGQIQAEAELNNRKTADAVWKAPTIESLVNSCAGWLNRDAQAATA